MKIKKATEKASEKLARLEKLQKRLRAYIKNGGSTPTCFMTRVQ